MNEFTDLQLRNKLFFLENQKELLSLINSEAGKWLIGIKEKHPIVKVDPNGWHFLKQNGEIEAQFFCYEKVAKYLLPYFTTKEIGESFDNYVFSPAVFMAAASYYSGAGDGQVRNYGADWNTVHDASTGTSADYTSDALDLQTYLSGNYYMSRLFFPIDTSGLPGDATISAATFSIHCGQKGSADPGIALVQTSQASMTSLVTGDLDQCGSINSPTEGALELLRI